MSMKIEFHKTKNYLICIDSDGCVMDTMNSKHFVCFGPKIVEIWNLKEYEEEILQIWNYQNLFSKTRGINRFQGLSLLFRTIADKGILISGREDLEAWCATTTSFSNDALRQEIAKNPSACLRKVLAWSNKVNEAIQEMPKTDCVFPGAKETMALLCEKADIAIVSSANKEAIQEEWTRLDCMKYVNVLCGQEAGSKSFCISELKQYYEDGHVMMIGDALSDLKAAQENGVVFYPILATHEAYSWLRFKQDVKDKFLKGELSEAYAEEMVNEMKDILE